MWDKNPLFLDYMEIRRRIESRLASRQGILTHIALFNIALIAIFIFTATIFNPALGYPMGPRSHFMDVNVSYLDDSLERLTAVTWGMGISEVRRECDCTSAGG